MDTGQIIICFGSYLLFETILLLPVVSLLCLDLNL